GPRAVGEGLDRLLRSRRIARAKNDFAGEPGETAVKHAGHTSGRLRPDADALLRPSLRCRLPVRHVSVQRPALRAHTEVDGPVERPHSRRVAACANLARTRAIRLFGSLYDVERRGRESTKHDAARVRAKRAPDVLRGTSAIRRGRARLDG